MCRIQSFLIVLLLLFGTSFATAQADDSSIDATMKKIYAEYGGKFHGEAHYRGVGDESDWTTTTHDVTCTQQGTWTGSCAGITGGSSWKVQYRYDAGTETVDGESDGSAWQMHYQIVDPWFLDAENFGYGRKWTNTSNGVKYEGIDEFVQMGKRGIVQSKVREAGSSGSYRFFLFEVLDRVE